MIFKKAPAARAHFAICLLLLAAGASAETSGTLRIEDVFSPPPEKPAVRDWPTSDPAIPGLRIPPRSLMKLRPTPTPNPEQGETTTTWRLVDVRGIRPRLPTKVDPIITREHPMFESKGKVSGSANDTTALGIQNRLAETYSRLVMIPVGDVPTSTTTILLGPGTGASFFVRMGVYRASHEVWDMDHDNHVFIEYPPQQLLPGFSYHAEWGQELEKEVRKRLKDLADQDRHKAAP